MGKSPAISLTDFKREYKSIQKKIDTGVLRVLKSGWYILEKEVEEFEKEFTKYIDPSGFGLGLASGTDALTIAIEALNLKNGDEVVLPANVYPSAFGVARSGISIKLADVNPNTLNIDLENIKKVVSNKTKAIIVVHLYGNPADIENICLYAKKKRIKVIEDCAQAFGSSYKNIKVGAWGDVGCFSFYPTKNLGAYGDGGAIFTKSKDIYERAKLLRMYGERERYKSEIIGYNSRLDEIQAAILRAKLPFINKWNARRKEIADYYRKNLQDLPIKILETLPDSDNVYHLFVIEVNNRDKLVNYLKQNGILTGIHYPIPIHKTKSFSFLGYRPGDFPVSERASRKVISLPMHPFLKDVEVKRVVYTLRKYCE